MTWLSDNKTSKFAYICIYAKHQSKRKRGVVTLDFLGPLLQSNQGVRHILVCVDVFIKAVQQMLLFEQPQNCSEDNIEKIYTHI